ncbi:hypothetical protein POVCU2_0076690 [Plasmodium ovale curtisi]|uniref:Uncharacterized protein n=1 Tax=Plasmodium ovale curtisi TaxID=864141 RepID=A0A1A8WNB7_PLAOA|nr:hypothetical protein POVCU2_0076690 [Plasmodium ovale curtisi]
MMFDPGKCNELLKSNGISGFLPQNIENLCKCFSNSDQQGEEKCDCNGLLENANLKSSFMKFQECHGTSADLNSGIMSNLKYFTNDCYQTSLRSILDSLGTDEICGVDMSSLKESGEKMLSYMGSIGGTVSGALEFVQKFKNTFASAKQFFLKIIEKFPGYTILYPIIKLFRCIFCRTKKENKEDYNEQMKQLQEQYNRTLQTSDQMNRFLLGYQNV